MGVDVHPGVAGKKLCEAGGEDAAGRGFQARLDDRIAGHNTTSRFVDRSAIQRVREQTNQASSSPQRKLSITVQGDHKTNPLEPRRIADPAQVACVLVAAQQMVQLFQFAALAFPAHESALGRVPARLAVQQQKRTHLAITVFAVQQSDAHGSALKQLAVFRCFAGVEVVGKQGEAKHRIGVRQVVHFELLQHVADVVRVSQQGRDHDQRAGVFRYALGVVELG